MVEKQQIQSSQTPENPREPFEVILVVLTIICGIIFIFSMGEQYSNAFLARNRKFLLYPLWILIAYAIYIGFIEPQVKKIFTFIAQQISNKFYLKSKALIGNVPDVLKYIPNNAKRLYNDEYYAESVFEAYKALEIFVKDKSGLQGFIGVALMRKAFDANTGVLRKDILPIEEREAMCHLFAGAIGFIRNPKAHRTVEVSQEKALELLVFADYLFGVIEE